MTRSWLRQGKPWTEIPAELLEPGDAFLVGGETVTEVALTRWGVEIRHDGLDQFDNPLRYTVGQLLTVRGRHPERGDVRGGDVRI